MEAILSLGDTEIAGRMANERIPVNVIARCLAAPAESVRNALETALHCGVIVEMPRADWPPTGKLSDHIPTRPPVPSDENIIFALRKLIKLTPLEANFLSVLMKFDEADKSKLHMVIENQRSQRAGGPSKMEQTDPKMVDVMICKLRKRLETFDPGLKIKTMWGSGYYIEEAVRRRLLDYVSQMLKDTSHDAAN